MDEGNIVFGAIAVLAVARIFEVGVWARHWDEIARATAAVEASAPRPPDSDADPDEGRTIRLGELRSSACRP